ncbi:MAG: hypothetical protein FVQ83_10910 [Chloroflexi bacterium]|nr:hypothetical protein [Chloroflexota bacterium]
MAKKKVGFVELQWTCPNCGTINPGPVKVCSSCGSPQPEDVEFEQAVRDELITDEEKLKQARAGADIHCGFCGTRNPGGAVTCSQCGGNLAEGEKRKSGRVIGKLKTGPAGTLICPNCGHENADTDKKCSQCSSPLYAPQDDQVAKTAAPQKKRGIPLWLIVILVVAVVGCGVLALLYFRTTEVAGVVTGVQWERSVAIQEFLPVDHEDWEDQVPFGAESISCSRQKRSESQNQPSSNVDYKEVCREEQVEDTGGGFGEVVQECEYHIYEDKCSYTIEEWTDVDTATLTGEDLNPAYPQPLINADQRLGDESETYTCIFDADNETKEFNTEDLSLYLQCEEGSEWTLEVNTFGTVLSINQ